MTALEQLLEDLIAKRDMANMDAKEAKARADAYDHAVIMTRILIKNEKPNTEEPRP